MLAHAILGDEYDDESEDDEHHDDELGDDDCGDDNHSSQFLRKKNITIPSLPKNDHCSPLVLTRLPGESDLSDDLV